MYEVYSYNRQATPDVTTTDFWTAHEAAERLRDSEGASAMVRRIAEDGKTYDSIYMVIKEPRA